MVAAGTASPAAAQRFVNPDEVSLRFAAGAASSLALGGGALLSQGADAHTDGTLRTTIAAGDARTLRYEADLRLTTDGLRSIESGESAPALYDPPAPLAVAVELGGPFGELYLGHVDSAAERAVAPLPGPASGGVAGRMRRFVPKGASLARFYQDPANADAQLAYRSLPAAGIRLGLSVAPVAGAPPGSLASKQADVAVFGAGASYRGGPAGWPLRVAVGFHGGGESAAGNTRQEIGLRAGAELGLTEVAGYFGADLTPDSVRQTLGLGIRADIFNDFSLGANLLRTGQDGASRLAVAGGATLRAAPGLALAAELAHVGGDALGARDSGDATLGIVTTRLFF